MSNTPDSNQPKPVSKPIPSTPDVPTKDTTRTRGDSEPTRK